MDDGPSGRKWVSELWFRLCTAATAAASTPPQPLPSPGRGPSRPDPMTEFAV